MKMKKTNKNTKKLNYWDIQITRTLLEKDEKLLSDVEKEAIAEYKERIAARNKMTESTNAEIKNNCKILCSGYDDEFIPSSGWKDPIRDFCYQLEALNYKYRKYGLKVVSDQNKTKYGTYRCYYEIMNVPTGIIKVITALPRKIVDKLNTLNYGIKYETIENAKVTIEWQEITKEEFLNHKVDNQCYNRDNYIIWNDDIHTISMMTKSWVSPLDKERMMYEDVYQIKDGKDVIDLSKTMVFKETKDGKYYVAYELHHSVLQSPKITKHRFLSKMKNVLNNFIWFVEAFKAETEEDIVMREAFDIEVEKLLKECEHECESRCECCGNHIEEHAKDEHYEMCITHGWISYLCERCAMALGDTYSKGNKVYREGKEVKEKKKS